MAKRKYHNPGDYRRPLRKNVVDSNSPAAFLSILIATTGMAPRRQRRRRGRRGGAANSFISYEFEGIFNTAAGSGQVSEVNITYGKLGMVFDRPLRPSFARVTLAVKNGAANVALAGVNPVDNTAENLTRVTPCVVGQTRTLSVRWSRAQDFITPAKDDVVLKIRVFSTQVDGTAANLIHGGLITFEFRRLNQPSTVKP